MFLLFLFLSAITMTRAAQVAAQIQYRIPVNWQLPPGQVNIVIPATPEWAHDVVADALRIWNDAQVWFKEKYFNTGEVYRFTEYVSGVEVRFVYRDQTSCGTIVEAPNGRVISLLLTNIHNVTLPSGLVTRCAEHELGHILGLGHTSVDDDLMSTSGAGPATPSTLDLYAVHLLAGGLKQRTTVTLPSDIAYAAVPEFLDPAVTVAAVLVVLAVVVRRGKTASLR